MSSEYLLLILIIVIGFGLIIWFIKKQSSRSGQDQVLTEWLKSTQVDLKTLQTDLTRTLQTSDKNVTDTLQKSYQELNQRLDSAAKVIGELKLETGKFSEIGRSMQDLQAFLNSPKLRGNLGEQVLTDLLTQVLPSAVYATQYHFQSGAIVDAVIKTQAGLIPIDSKFPMENFIKIDQAATKKEQAVIEKLFISDVRKHIRAIADKYINPAEHTVDFALMYVPSETLYYAITAQTPALSTYAQDNRVLPVSPSTFYAFLKTILVSFEGQRIQQEAKTILQNLRSIQKDAGDFALKLDTLNRHLTNAYHNMNTVSGDFSRLHGKINATQALGSGLNQEKTSLITNSSNS